MDIASAERLRYLRRLYLWPLPILLPAFAFAVAADWGSWWLVLLGVGAVCWVRGFASVGRDIRNDRVAGADPRASR
jgi:4-hydroxybenzoate polyprenyltransferase